MQDKALEQGIEWKKCQFSRNLRGQFSIMLSHGTSSSCISPSLYPRTGKNGQRCGNNKTSTVCFVFRLRWWHESLLKTRSYSRWCNFKTICCNLLNNEVKPGSPPPACHLPLFWHIPKMPLASSQCLWVPKHTGGDYGASALMMTVQALLIHGKCEMPKFSSTPAQRHYNRASFAMLSSEVVSIFPVSEKGKVTLNEQQIWVNLEFIGGLMD